MQKIQLHSAKSEQVPFALAGRIFTDNKVMILQKLSILNYRNLREVTLQLSPKLNCLIGRNGMGKTNLLDAVYYLSFCRSAFNPIDSQVLMHGQDFFVIEGHYLSDDEADAEHIYCGMKRGQRKLFKRNQKAYQRLAQHIGLIPLVFVSPADQQLISGGSDERRRFMDLIISQYDHPYIDHLIAYNKALQQRNALLKQEAEPDVALLDILETEMAKHGEQIFVRREKFVTELIPIFQEIYQRIAAGGEQVSLGYFSHCQRGPLLDVIRRDRFKDRAVGYSLHGIHRDDLDMLLDGYSMRREGSQGQTKTYALALRLAQYEFLCRSNKTTKPLLLLDDIFDKLDAQRVEQIVKLVAGDHFGQIFITDTNRDHLDSILSESGSDYKLFIVKDGVITANEQ